MAGINEEIKKKNIYKNIVLLKVLNADRRAPASFGETNVTGSGVLIRGRKQAEELRHVQSTDVTLLLLLLLLFLLLLLPLLLKSGPGADPSSRLSSLWRGRAAET